MNPVHGRITSHFGKRRHPVIGIYSFHNGIDIACKCGTPVLAPDYGTITEVWDHPLGGKCLAMMSMKGIRYGFAHLSGRSVVNGQSVVEGQQIALSGNTGRSTGPHVHFTVKVNDSWVDPLKYFKY